MLKMLFYQAQVFRRINNTQLILFLTYVTLLEILEESKALTTSSSKTNDVIAAMLKKCGPCDQPKLELESPGLGELGGGCAVLHDPVHPNCFDGHARCTLNITTKRKVCACNFFSEEHEFPISGKRLCFMKSHAPCDDSLFRTAAKDSLWPGAMDLFLDMKFLDSTIADLKKTTFPSCSADCMARMTHILESIRPLLNSSKNPSGFGCLSGICKMEKVSCDRRGGCMNMVGKCVGGKTNQVLTRAAEARNDGQMHKSMLTMVMTLICCLVLQLI